MNYSVILNICVIDNNHLLDNYEFIYLNSHFVGGQEDTCWVVQLECRAGI